jgi:hypothetical protein
MLVAVSFLSGGCSKRPAHGVLTSSESIVIEPGASIGPVRSDMTMQQVVAELGEPDRTNDQTLEYLNLGLSKSWKRRRAMTMPPNNSLQPTPVGRLISAFAVDITGPAWLSSGR